MHRKMTTHVKGHCKETCNIWPHFITDGKYYVVRGLKQCLDVGGQKIFCATFELEKNDQFEELYFTTCSTKAT